MLTDYMVTCPYPGCRWFGSLFPQGNREAWKPAEVTALHSGLGEAFTRLARAETARVG